MSSKTAENRMIHYDLLRIAAAFSVVMLHSAAQFWYSLDVSSTEWQIANTYDALFRFGVPVFVMISGALFLNREYHLDLKRLYKHNILRLVILYIIWSCLYGICDIATYHGGIPGYKDIIRECLYGRYHLWFLPMLAGIYVLLPVLKSWVEHAERKNIEYFLLLFFVLQICSSTLRALTVTDELHMLLELTKVEMACSYIGYFIWGYYLAHVGISDRLGKGFCLLAIPACICNVVLGNSLAKRAGYAVGEIYDSFGLFTFIIATALFWSAVRLGSKISFGRRTRGIIKEISACTLGVYVMHIGLMEISFQKGIHSMLLPNVLGIPLYALACFLLCTAAAAVLRRIPLIGKYIC